ncbi:MAG: pyridoxal phosphate-dependent class II aminotransferase [Desulfamplus sp.]|nr:pyridoxal phosphate-dependent class II aminotransferase [Desulfamplus sp.]
MIKGHGGNVEDLAKIHNCSVDEIIDMSSNINPLGPPDGIEEFIAANLNLIRSLPQPDAADMCAQFSKYHNIPVDMVAAGNGTTWFIYTLATALRSKNILIVGPTYSDYFDSCTINSIPCEFYISDESTQFEPNIDKIEYMLKDFDTVIICNPNNPTGVFIPAEKIVKLVEKYPATYFVVDESYLPFLPDAKELSLISHQTSFSNLIVLSSMSKIFRIPGLRVGFLSANPLLIQRVMRYYQPWSVNSLSQAVTKHIFENRALTEPFLKMTRSFVQREKKIFEDALSQCRTLKLYPSHTYFILAKITGSMKSDKLCQLVGEHKILIRDCSNFRGLSDQFVRFSLRDRETNLRLAHILQTTTK